MESRRAKRFADSRSAGVAPPYEVSKKQIYFLIRAKKKHDTHPWYIFVIFKSAL
jgi:hypothetical protein